MILRNDTVVSEVQTIIQMYLIMVLCFVRSNLLQVWLVLDGKHETYYKIKLLSASIERSKITAMSCVLSFDLNSVISTQLLYSASEHFRVMKVGNSDH